MTFTTESVTECPACFSTKQHMVSRPDMFLCEDCSLFFRNPRPTQESILNHYDAGQTFNFWQQELPIRRFLWRKRCQLILKYKRSGSLLDVGTGDGFFLGFSKKYYDSYATEISLTGGQYAKSHGHVVHHGSLSDLPNTHKQFDVITLWHVLEHVPDPSTLLDEIRSRMHPDGIFAVAIPNEWLLITKDKHFHHTNRTIPKHSMGEFVEGQEIHLTHFTPQVFKTFLKKHGFKILDFGVDDVHIERHAYEISLYHLNRFINSIFRWHFDRAMYAICSIQHDL